jgi:import receptor subunit TOM20
MNKVTAALILVGSLLTATAGYAVYFDYKRRNDPDFRRRLRTLFYASSLFLGKTKKRAQKDKQATEITQEQDLARMIASSLKIANQDQAQLPTTIDGKEKYFMEQVAKGEALVPNGNHAF